MISKFFQLTLYLSLITSSLLPAEEIDNNRQDKEDPKKLKGKDVSPPKIGNFALPTSQQPAALFGFGGNVIDEGEVMLYLFADSLVGNKRLITDVIPSVLFGINDDCSIFFNFPVTPKLQDGCQFSRGLEDFFIQFEYAFYENKTTEYIDEATILASLLIPTGSIKYNPPTGLGAPGFFVGGTFYRTWVDWFVFTAQGALLTTSDRGTKIGDQFLYQFGIGKNVPSPKDWIYAWMLEVDGQYGKRNRIKGKIDPRSGGNLVLVTPSLWMSSKQLLIQFGVSLPINQNLFGNQNKIDYALNLNVAWSFYKE